MLLPYSALIAQSGIEYEGRTDPVMEVYRDSLQGWYDDHFPVCAGPGLVSVTPVYYQNYVNFELVFNGVVDTSAIDLYSPGSPSLAYGTLQVLDTGRVLLKNIPLDLDLRLQWGYYCNSTLVEVDVSTSIPQNGDQIEVNDEVFSAANEYKMTADSSLKLNQVIRNNAAISHYKKLHFFQNFYLGGAPYDQNFDEALPDQAYLLDKMRALGYNSDISLDHDGKPAESSASAKPCNCKVLLNQTQLLVPVSAKTLERSFRSDDSEIAGLWQNRQMHGGYHFNRGNFGPAMYAHLVTTGHKVAGEERNVEFGSTKTPEKAGTRIHASLIYHLICSDEQDIMEGCACRRIVRAGWMYEMNMSAEARLGQNTVVRERKSHTYAENIVLVTKSFGQDIKVLSAKRISMSAVCNAVRDTALINGIPSLSAIAGRIIAGDTLRPETVTQIQNAISNLLPGNTGYSLVKECSSATAFDVELTRGEDTITLHAGGPMRRLDLMSFFGFRGGGMRNWQNASRIHSNFYLAGSIPGGTDLSNEGGEGFKPCCTQKTATYISATVPGSVKTESQLRQSLWSNFLFLYQPWQRINDIPTHGGIQMAHLVDQHYGKLLGLLPETDSCRFIEIVINPPGKAFVESRIHQESVIKVFPDQLVIILENSDELIDQSIRYVLSDMQGRVLASGSEAVQREVNIPVKQDMAWQLPGLYLLTYQIGRELPVTLKINKI